MRVLPGVSRGRPENDQVIPLVGRRSFFFPFSTVGLFLLKDRVLLPDALPDPMKQPDGAVMLRGFYGGRLIRLLSVRSSPHRSGFFFHLLLNFSTLFLSAPFLPSSRWSNLPSRHSLARASPARPESAMHGPRFSSSSLFFSVAASLPPSCSGSREFF